MQRRSSTLEGSYTASVAGAALAMNNPAVGMSDPMQEHSPRAGMSAAMQNNTTAEELLMAVSISELQNVLLQAGHFDANPTS